MDSDTPTPTTQAEDLFADLHEHLTLERLGQGMLTGVLDATEPARDELDHTGPE